MVFVALLGCALVAYWAGSRAQRYRQARTDVRDEWAKLRKVHRARRPVRAEAVAGWLVLAAVAALGVLVLLAAGGR